MIDLRTVKINGELYVPDKYKNQASEYTECVQGINTSLESAINELNNVNELLGLDGESAKDALTKNVIVSNEEIKAEISNLAMDLEGYSDVVSKVAKDLDSELEAEATAIAEQQEREEQYLRKLRLEREEEERLAREKENPPVVDTPTTPPVIRRKPGDDIVESYFN